MQDDIRMEKLLEAMYDDLSSHLCPEMRGECPMLKRIGEFLVHMKTENNGRIISEFGLGDDSKWHCHCKNCR